MDGLLQNYIFKMITIKKLTEKGGDEIDARGLRVKSFLKRRFKGKLVVGLPHQPL